jgi:putative aminopeptidase FrvX
MDHPGFVFPRSTKNGALSAEFLGGVGDAYFKEGVKLRLWPGNVPATLGKLREKRVFEIRTAEQLTVRPEFAVWDLPDFEFSSETIRGRVCDDLIGVATILTVLIASRGSKAAANLIGVLSRAEEVGFHGALALAKSKILPKGALVISLETSRELPPVKMGHGVIIRVGDRASIFDSTSTRFLAEVAGDLAKKDPSFKFQRALMSGGTCEATAYQEYGYRCAAVCVALGNYHNCGENEQIAAEFVNANDAESMADLLLECAKHWSREEAFTARLPKRLEKLSREAQRELRRRPLTIEKRSKTRA